LSSLLSPHLSPSLLHSFLTRRSSDLAERPRHPGRRPRLRRHGGEALRPGEGRRREGRLRRGARDPVAAHSGGSSMWPAAPRRVRSEKPTSQLPSPPHPLFPPLPLQPI